MAIVTPENLIEHAALLADEPPAHLQRLIDAGQDLLERQLGFKIASRFGGIDQEPVPASLRLAVLMLAAHWYENREATLVGVTAQALPWGVPEIVSEFRDYTYG